MSKASKPLRYWAARLRLGFEEAYAQLSDTTFPTAVQSGLDAYRRQLTGVIAIGGTAMLPTLNRQAESSSDALERLLVRWLPRASGRSVFVGDVVAVQSSGSEGLFVRRIAAVEGDEMVSEKPDDKAFILPQGQCWVLADNEQLSHTEVTDSRSLGPLPFQQIVGRVLYALRSSTDHNVVENSDAAMAADGPVLQAELDLDELSNPNQ